MKGLNPLTLLWVRHVLHRVIRHHREPCLSVAFSKKFLTTSVNVNKIIVPELVSVLHSGGGDGASKASELDAWKSVARRRPNAKTGTPGRRARRPRHVLNPSLRCPSEGEVRYRHQVRPQTGTPRARVTSRRQVLPGVEMRNHARTRSMTSVMTSQ